MLEPRKAVADLRAFVAARIDEGQSLQVDEIGTSFLKAAHGEAYRLCTAADLEPFVQTVVAEYTGQPTPQEARKHAEELRNYVKNRRVQN